MTKEFGSLAAVSDVSLDVVEGELHSIIGPNGAGKSTLFNLIAGSYTPTRGRIRYRGTDVTDVPEHERAARGICRVFQIAQLFPNLSIRENVRIAAQSRSQRYNPLVNPPESLAERADEVLDWLELDVDRESPAANLSHGDRKKLELGMGVITDPDLLLLDEPTSGVSESDSGWIMDAVDDIAGDTTVLLIEHDIDMVLGLSDHITVLHYGEVIAHGTPDEVEQNEAVQDAYLGGGDGV
ncbi:MAG: ABC transporter ATP-binding protein [Salinigranum sp.]